MKVLRLTALALAITLIVIGCMQLPETPKFDTTFKLPLINKYYYIHELEDSTDFIVENDSIFYMQNGNISSYAVDSLISIQAAPEIEQWIPVTSNTENAGYLSLNDTGFGSGDVTVSYGLIKTWTMLIEVRDPHPDLASLRIRFDEIFTPEGDTLQIDITEFNDTTRVSLDGVNNRYFRIGSPEDETLRDSLRFTVEPQIEIAGSQQVCDIQVFFTEDIYFQQMHGSIYNKRMYIEDEIESIDIDYPENLDSTLTITQARMHFNITNRLGFRVSIRGKMTAYNDLGESRSIYIDSTDNLVFDAATTPGVPATSTQTLTDSISYLLNIFPTRIEFTNSYFVVGQDETEYGFASVGDHANGDFQGRVPFLFTLDEGLIRNDSTYVTELSDEVRDRIREFAQSASIRLSVKNTTPTAAHAYLYFSTIEHPDTLFHEPDSTFSAWNLLLPREGEDTYTPANSTKDFTFNLSEEDLRFFTNEKYYLGIEFLFDSTEGETIYIKPEDFLRLDGDLNIVLHFGD